MSTFILILFTGIGLGALYFLVASGLSLIYGLMGVLNFAHGTFLTVGAFVGLWLMQSVFKSSGTVSFFAAMLIGGLASGLFALLMEQLLIKKLYDRHIDQALVTVGVSLAIGALLAGWFGSDLRLMLLPNFMNKAWMIGGAAIPVDRLVYVAVAVILLLGNFALMKFTRIGLVIRAGVENRTMVTALGVNVKLAFSFVFFLGGFAAGIGGVLIASYSSGVSPLMAGSWLIYGFIVVVVGGMGSVGGSFAAAMLIGVLKQFTNYYASSLGDFVIVAVLVVVLLTRPQGLAGKVSV
jgi:branched-chain amino acid transport system permease protein